MSTTLPPAPPPPAAPPSTPVLQPISPPPGPARSGLALRIGAIITGLLIILGALNLFSLTLGRDSERSQYAFSTSATSLLLSSDAADVTVVSGVAGESGRVTVERKASTAHGRSVSAPRLSGGTLSLPGDCHGGPVGWLLFCSVSYVVHVPSGLDLAVRTGSGDVKAVGLTTSGLRVETGSGDLTLSDLGGPSVSARTGSGDIDATALATPAATLRTGSGDVHVDFAVPPTDVNAETGSGDLTLAVPRDDSVYTVHQDTGSGDYTNHLVSSDQAPASGAVQRVLTVSTGSGDLTLRYLG